MKLLHPGPNLKHPAFSLLWRGLLFTPLLSLLGVAMLIAAFALLILPPAHALIFLISSDYLYAALLFAIWAWSLRHTKRLLAWLLQGIEHSSL